MDKNTTDNRLNILLGLVLSWLVICGIVTAFILSGDSLDIPNNAIKFIKDGSVFLLLSAIIVFCIVAMNRIAENIRSLRHTNESLVIDKRDLECENLEIESKSTLLKEENRRLKDANADSGLAKTKLKGLNEDLMHKVEQSEQRGAALRGELEEYKNKLSDHVAKNESLMHKNEDLIRQIARLKTEQAIKLKEVSRDTQHFYIPDSSDKGDLQREPEEVRIKENELHEGLKDLENDHNQNTKNEEDVKTLEAVIKKLEAEKKVILEQLEDSLNAVESLNEANKTLEQIEKYKRLLGEINPPEDEHGPDQRDAHQENLDIDKNTT